MRRLMSRMASDRPPGRVHVEHDRRGIRPLGIADDAVDVAGHDRVDDALDLADEDLWLVGLGEGRAGGKRRCDEA